MLVVEHMKCILETMRLHFKQIRVFRLFQSHILSILEMPGRHTISNAICFKGDDDKDWTRDYRLFSTSQWDVKGCLNIIFQEALHHLPEETPFIPIAIDLTSVRKTSKKIPLTNYVIDPLSPPFCRGLMLGQRFLHASVLLPMHKYGIPARGIPIRLEASPYVKKPGKKASKEEWEQYKQARKEYNSNIHTIKMIKEIINIPNLPKNKRILLVGDGGFCNQHCFKSLPEGVDLLVRCRKDAKLCYRSEESGSFYGSNKFTPEDVRKDEKISWLQTKAFYGGDWRDVEYKEIKNVYWQRGAQKRGLRVIVIKPMPYRQTGSGYNNYRENCYLLTTDLVTDPQQLIQAYFDRIEIEQNHRDMKNSLGLGEAQVWTEPSVERHPQTIMLAYSTLLLAILRLLGPKRDAKDYMPPPKWYKGRKRPTIEDMRRRIRQEMMDYPEWREYYGIHLPWERTTTKLVA